MHKLIPHTILSLPQDQPPRLSRGLRQVDWVYVEDVISALISAVLELQAVGVIIDIGSGRLVRVREVVGESLRRIPRLSAPHCGALPDRVMENVRCAETATAMYILDWKATSRRSVDVSATIDWYRGHVVATSNSCKRTAA